MASTQSEIGERERKAERLSVDEAARLKPNDWSSVEIRMVDLSPLGFRASCEARIVPGSCVSLDIPGIGEVLAQVEWRRGDEFGARFVTPIILAACRWRFAQRRGALARLLIERAAARRAGRTEAERKLRTTILGALPIQSGTAVAS
ncbi:MAG: hypothetical protein JWO25_2731 [Alphaproteobacteria bacterium]|nr:hypothetical protein [Alphaproteobacteria bacterium]